MDFFNTSTTALTVWGYDMSWLELVGTILNIATVYLLTKRKIINWPIGIVAASLFAILFFKFQLYSDFIENIYYVATGFWGWWLWTRKGAKDNQNDALVRTASQKEIKISAIVIVLGTVIMGCCISNLHIWLPNYFPEQASLPYLDTLTTVMSFTAQILLTRRVLANWYLWIVVDVIGVWLYWYKELKLVSFLYLIFLVLATKGLLDWRKQYAIQESRKQKVIDEEE